MIKVKIDHKARRVLFENHGERFIENGTRRALQEIGKFVKKETRQGIERPPKTGIIYGNHRASRGIIEYPANKTGNLKRSLNYRVKGRTRMTVGMNAKYANFLEEGTRNMEKRKLLGFTIEKNRDKIKDILRKYVNSEFK